MAAAWSPIQPGDTPLRGGLRSARELRFFLLPMIDSLLLALGDGSWLATLPSEPSLYGAPQHEFSMASDQGPPDFSEAFRHYWLSLLGMMISWYLLADLPIRQLQALRRRLIRRLPRHRRVRLVWLRLAVRVARQTRVAHAEQIGLLSSMVLILVMQAGLIPILLLPFALLMLSHLVVFMALHWALPRPGRPRPLWEGTRLGLRDISSTGVEVKKAPATTAAMRPQAVADGPGASHRPRARRTVASARRRTSLPVEPPPPDPPSCVDPFAHQVVRRSPPIDDTPVPPPERWLQRDLTHR